MKSLFVLAGLAALGVGCATGRSSYVGTGGSGVSIEAATEACTHAAHARGWHDLTKLEEVKVTGSSTAKLRFDRSGMFHKDATCYYDANTNSASID